MAGFDKTLTHTARVETDWIDPSGRQCKNIWYADGADYSSLTNLGLVASALLAFWNTVTAGAATYKLFATGWDLTGIVAADNGGTSENVVELGGPGLPPTGSAGPPPNCCTVVSWVIGASYRGGHPRSYFPPGPVDILDTPGGSNWNDAYVANVAAHIGPSLTAANATLPSGGSFGTISASRHGVQRTPPVFYPFLGSVTRQRVCTQRRRLGKTGG